MKNVCLIVLSLLSFGFYSCKDECSYPAGSECLEKEIDAVVSYDSNTVVTYESWFYDVDKNSCEKKIYNGSKEVGFKTEQECLECDCN